MADEQQSTDANQEQNNQGGQQTSQQAASSNAVKDKKVDSTVTKIRALNPIVALFALIIVGTILVIVFATLSNNEESTDFQPVELSEEELSNLESTENEIETTAQRLTIGPSTEFSNNVLIKDSLEVVGDLSVNGNITIPNLDITNGATLQGADISGDLSVSGNQTIQGSLSVNGGANIDGLLTAASLNTGTLSLSSDLVLSRHIRAEAASTSASAGTGVGSGGTVSVSGDDIAGTVNVNTGGSPPSGKLVDVSFSIPYGSTPSVIVTPVGSGGGNIGFYTQRSTNGFSIYSKTGAPAGASFQFDYIVIE